MEQNNFHLCFINSHNFCYNQLTLNVFANVYISQECFNVSLVSRWTFLFICVALQIFVQR